MPYKDPAVRKAKHKEYSAEHYKRNTEEVRVRMKARRSSLKKEWKVFKASLSCVKCGFNHPAALDFHHEDPKTKKASVNSLVRDGKFAAAMEEVQKCTVLCANCHRVHHHEEHEAKKAAKKRKKKGAETP